MASLQFNMASLDKNGPPVVTPAIDVDAMATDPYAMLNLMGTDRCFRIIWDTGASISISHDAADFVGGIKPLTRRIQMDGIASGLEVCGQGIVRWCVLDTKGKVRVLELPALYIPAGKQRLMSITSLSKVYSGEEVSFNAHRGLLTGVKNNPDRQAVVVLVDPRTDLPTSTAFNQ